MMILSIRRMTQTKRWSCGSWRKCQKILKTVARNHFQGDIYSAKVLPLAIEDDIEGQNHVVCVYTKDFTNRKQCLKVESWENWTYPEISATNQIFTPASVFTGRIPGKSNQPCNSSYHLRSIKAQISFFLTSGVSITMNN